MRNGIAFACSAMTGIMVAEICVVACFLTTDLFFKASSSFRDMLEMFFNSLMLPLIKNLLFVLAYIFPEEIAANIAFASILLLIPLLASSPFVIATSKSIYGLVRK